MKKVDYAALDEAFTRAPYTKRMPCARCADAFQATRPHQRLCCRCDAAYNFPRFPAVAANVETLFRRCIK